MRKKCFTSTNSILHILLRVLSHTMIHLPFLLTTFVEREEVLYVVVECGALVYATIEMVIADK